MYPSRSTTSRTCTAFLNNVPSRQAASSSAEAGCLQRKPRKPRQPTLSINIGIWEMNDEANGVNTAPKLT